MRVNVYAEEMTGEVELIEKKVGDQTFTGVRFPLYLPVTQGGNQVQGPFKHGPDDDDSSAVTFWGKRVLRDTLQKALALLGGGPEDEAMPPERELSFQERVVEEKKELDSKLSRLNIFTTGQVFGDLAKLEQDRLIKQEELMGSYSSVLGERIASFGL